jgi:hypothetical protein
MHCLWKPLFALVAGFHAAALALLHAVFQSVRHLVPAAGVAIPARSNAAGEMPAMCDL